MPSPMPLSDSTRERIRPWAAKGVPGTNIVPFSRGAKPSGTTTFEVDLNAFSDATLEAFRNDVIRMWVLEARKGRRAVALELKRVLRAILKTQRARHGAKAHSRGRSPYRNRSRAPNARLRSAPLDAEAYV
jgi:hypothetical protein